MTRVDEWTNEETGVGAAMAAGSHEEKGICALLVKDAIIIINITIWLFFKKKVYQEISILDSFMIIEIAKIKKMSPKRLVKAVTIPALYDLFLL